MPSTSVYNIPYLEPSDPPDIPAVTQGIAEAAEDELSRIDAEIAAIRNPTAVPVSFTAPSFLNATSTTYTNAVTGGTAQDCGVAFVAPASGRVLVHWWGQMSNSATASTYLGMEVRTGGTIGSGSQVPGQGPTDDDSCRVAGTNAISCQSHRLVTGLTPDETYHAWLLHRVSSASTATIHKRRVTVVPMP